jgi:hypothetical protein
MVDRITEATKSEQYSTSHWRYVHVRVLLEEAEEIQKRGGIDARLTLPSVLTLHFAY